jgi:hypothetical protein
LQEYAVMSSIQKHQVSYQIFGSKLKVFLLHVCPYSSFLLKMTDVKVAHTIRIHVIKPRGCLCLSSMVWSLNDIVKEFNLCYIPECIEIMKFLQKCAK